MSKSPSGEVIVAAGSGQAEELVLRDLVDTLIQERVGPLGRLRPGRPGDLGDHPLAPGEFWCHAELDGAGVLAFRARAGGALQRFRLSRGPVWSTVDGVLDAPALVTSLAGRQPGAAQLAEDLRTAAEHTAVLRHTADEHTALDGERHAAIRNRPFHPTARAVAGWSPDELCRYGPMRPDPLGLDWVGVHTGRLRTGGEHAMRLPELLLAPDDHARLDEAVRRAGREFLPLPVHPWQFERVLPEEFAAELAAGQLVPLERDLGAFWPTAALRTLRAGPRVHVKLPLGVATLGATRLLPPRYLDNGARAQRTMAGLLDRDARLARRVSLCEESSWCGWRDDDEFADRPGSLAAQLRVFPDGFDERTVLPMGALAVPGHGVRVDDPVRFFGALAEGFCELALGFLRYGVLPELHGQNVLVSTQDGDPRFVLRDHDTLRMFPGWMAAAEVPDPGYRIKPGAPQSLHLDSGAALLGYLQTLGFQVNLYAIADTLARKHAIDERVFWAALRDAISVAAQRIELHGEVADVVRRELLDARQWPNRQILRPLLRAGRSAGVSMPASTGSVPNPLLASRMIAERAARQRLLNAFCRETGQGPAAPGPFELALPGGEGTLTGTAEHVSACGHHEYGDEFRTGHRVLAHHELVDLLLAGCGATAGFSAQVEASVARTARYLERPPLAAEPVRHAEQSVLLGHPLHPTPKGAHELDDEYLPELGASFGMHWYAVHPGLLADRRVLPGPQAPSDAEQAAPPDFAVLPVHPWQARYLAHDPDVRAWLHDGALLPLEVRTEVYPTSSVRTVCAPEFPAAWKLPLHVRVTNFVRTNPGEHVRRALDASAVLGGLRERWTYPGFGVLLETGYRGVRHERLSPEFSVLYRENPFAHNGEAPRVLAGLLEDRMDGTEPELLRCVRLATGCADRRVPAERIAEWLRRYLRISLLPMLEIFAADGVSLEAHTQNSLLHNANGWPDRFYVRDMEGTSISRRRASTALPDDSPALYDDEQAWLRLRYNVITNQLGQLVYVLGRHGGCGEAWLWGVLRELLRDEGEPWCAAALLGARTLPAKANLRSWCTGRPESPLYVDIPNPIREVPR